MISFSKISFLNKLPYKWFCPHLGTLRPDLIESASALASCNADAIKTHHNDTDLVRVLRDEGRVIEPLKDFHKDEVRLMGKDLGLPDEVVQRHPFPGNLNNYYQCICYILLGIEFFPVIFYRFIKFILLLYICYFF